MVWPCWLCSAWFSSQPDLPPPCYTCSSQTPSSRPGLLLQAHHTDVNSFSPSKPRGTAASCFQFLLTIDHCSHWEYSDLRSHQVSICRSKLEDKKPCKSLRVLSLRPSSVSFGFLSWPQVPLLSKCLACTLVLKIKSNYTPVHCR